MGRSSGRSGRTTLKGLSRGRSAGRSSGCSGRTTLKNLGMPPGPRAGTNARSSRRCSSRRRSSRRRSSRWSSSRRRSSRCSSRRGTSLPSQVASVVVLTLTARSSSQAAWWTPTGILNSSQKPEIPLAISRVRPAGDHRSSWRSVSFSICRYLPTKQSRNPSQLPYSHRTQAMARSLISLPVVTVKILSITINYTWGGPASRFILETLTGYACLRGPPS